MAGDERARAVDLEGQLALRAQRLSEGPPAVDIVIPIHDAREETLQCIESVRRHATDPWRLVLIDDASTDEDLRAALVRFANQDERVVLLENERNLGFVRSANRGLCRAGTRDVVLLNSDTIVTAGFLDALRAAAHATPATGIACPLSNNAEILSVPIFCADNPIPDGLSIDEVAALVTSSSLQLRPEIVTAVGFCMYIRRTVLDAVGAFDEQAFQMGYGEENDLCERALAAGFEIRLADDAFVYHKGGASFRSATEALKRKNSEVLAARHPDYFPKVARFIAANPLAPVQTNVRLALQRGRCSDPALLVLVRACVLGAPRGVERHARMLIAALRLPRAVVAHPYPHGIEAHEIFAGDVGGAITYRFPLPEAQRLQAHGEADLGMALRQMIQLLRVRAAHVHDLVGWPPELPHRLAEAGVPYVLSVHDLSLLVPSLNAPASHPVAASGNESTRKESDQPDHGASFHLIANARAAICPSRFTLDALQRSCLPRPPELRVIAQAPGHNGLVKRLAPQSAAERRLRIAAIGTPEFAPPEGDRYLRLLRATRNLDVEWHVFGDVDAFGLEAQLRALGLDHRLVLHRLDERSIASRLVEAGIDLTALVSVEPRAFPYELSEALCVGVPVIVAGASALAEQVENGVTGLVVADEADAARAIERLSRSPEEMARLFDGASRHVHRTPADMAADHLALYEELFQGAAAGDLGLEERRALLAAFRAAEVAEPACAPVERVPIGLLSTSLIPLVSRVASILSRRRTRRLDALERALERRTVRGWSFGRTAGEASTRGLRRLAVLGSRVVYRSLDADPQIVCTPVAFSPSSVHEILFELRCWRSRSGVAQIFWINDLGEDFAENKSIRVPLAPTSGWVRYTVRLDRPEVRARWLAGSLIRAIRFDPVDHPGLLELRSMRLLG